MYECCLCGVVLGENPKIFWCSKCYSDWKDDILNRKEWTLYLQRLEKNRRYGEKTKNDLGVQLVYLSDKFEIAMVNNKVKLVPTKEYFDEVD